MFNSSQSLWMGGPSGAITLKPIMQFWCPLRIRIYRKNVTGSILWFKPKSLTFSEIFVSQDFTIRTAPGFRGPTNMCDTSIQIYKHKNIYNKTSIQVQKSKHLQYTLNSERLIVSDLPSFSNEPCYYTL